MITKENMPECDVVTTVQLIGSKWKTLIIRDLITGPKRHAELKKIACRNLAKNTDRQLKNDDYRWFS